MSASDDPEESLKRSPKRRWTDFECPGCSAQNVSEPFGPDDEIMCQYCSTSYSVRVTEGGKLQLKEL